MRERYGNLLRHLPRNHRRERLLQVPMRIFPAVHYTMYGGLWVDYNLMSNVPGLFVLGEANFSDHGANRLGASALMQGLADGYFVILPTRSATMLASLKPGARPAPDAAEFRQAEDNVRGVTRPTARRQGPQKPSAISTSASGRSCWQYLRHLARDRGGPGAGTPGDPRLARGVLEQRGRCPARPTRSTRRSSARAGWPIFSNWASCSASTPSPARRAGRQHFREEYQYPDGECPPRRREFRACERLGAPGRWPGAAPQCRNPAQL